MSEYFIYTVLAAFAFLYSIIASRLERTPVNGALVYLFAGLICGTAGMEILVLDIDAEGIGLLAEVTLALVLFADSSNANLGVLRQVKAIPTRLLLIGLPLTIAAGFAVGLLIFDQLTFIEIALLATMLAPTDAALGQAVVTNKTVPDSVRESLNVESGLNDGICVPVLLIFLALAAGDASSDESAHTVIALPFQEIGFGIGVGVLMATFGSFLVIFCGRRGWISGSWTGIPVTALAMLCFALSQWMGGSGFIGAFVGGLVFGWLIKGHDVKEKLLHGAEGMGNLMSLLTWFVFGAVAFGHGLQNVTWQVITYALLSLTIIRVIPVVLCLGGVGIRMDSKLFIGWFGPRGLASIVFIVMVIGTDLPGGDTLRAVVTLTVAMSIIAHGLSAIPYAAWYARAVGAREGSV